MKIAAKYVWAALIAAAATHFAAIHALPRLLMQVAIDRVSADGANQWRVAPRITPNARNIVRPSPDFAYSVCAYDLRRRPVRLHVEPWGAYWSLSLYADNSDNFYVIGDREAHNGGELVLTRRGQSADDGAMVIESPTPRGVALIRRLAPNPAAYAEAARIAAQDVCAPIAP